MTYIRWDETFHFNPSTGEAVPGGTPGAVPWVAYGNYGGADFSSGEFGGGLLTNAAGNAYTYRQLLTVGNDAQDPVDILDYLFYVHDVGSSEGGEGYTQDQAVADARLLKSLVRLDAAYDPEASLYAGFATLAMAARLIINDELSLLSPQLLLKALKDAANDILFGLENLPATEVAEAANAIFDLPAGPNGPAFDFDITTTSLKQEAYEFIALNALNRALDFGEVDDAALHTGLPLPGTSAYRLAFDVTTKDVDLLSI